jgi:hypothetical protein
LLAPPEAQRGACRHRRRGGTPDDIDQCAGALGSELERLAHAHEIAGAPECDRVEQRGTPRCTRGALLPNPFENAEVELDVR